MELLELVRKRSSGAFHQRVVYSGEMTPRILIIQEQCDISRWLEHFAIPQGKLGVITIQKNKKLLPATKGFLLNYLIILKPELVITVGATCGRFMKSDLKLTTDAGILFPRTWDFNLPLCPLLGPGYFKHKRYNQDEFKQMDTLKKYLIHQYKYGV